jgi:hypothetical protein
MKLVEFLKPTVQVEHHRELSELKFLDMLKENCRNSYSVIRQSPIYLSDKTLKKDFLLITPEVREIKTAFWLDRMVKEMNSWKRFPSRSKFLRGYTTIDRAGDQESVYVMIPFDMTRVGICPASTFYRSFTKAQKDFDVNRLDNDGFSTWIMNVVKGLNALDSESDISTDEPETTTQFNKLLASIDKALLKKDYLKKQLKENDTIKDEERKVVHDLLQRHITNIQNYIEEKLDPESNGFSCVRVESFARPSDVKEVWIDKPCLLVKREKYLEMHKRGDVK